MERLMRKGRLCLLTLVVTAFPLVLSASLPVSAGSPAPSAQVPAPGYPEGRYADIPGARLFYFDTGGSGVPVVFMHAATGSSQVWEYQIPVFTAAGYRVIGYDRRGWGRTEIVPETGAQPGTGADDLLALMDFLGIDRFHLVGTAAGAITSLDFALSFPERLISLTAANTTFGVRDPEYLALGARLRPQPQFNELPPDFRELSFSYRAANPEGTERWLALESISRPPGPLAPAQATRNMLTFNLLETITLPTLLITGDADLYTPPSVFRMFTERMPLAEALIVDEAGHSAYWEQPELFNATVLSFIRRAEAEDEE
jgi:pimeloyl-ACP methyl ester carboxylesterase